MVSRPLRHLLRDDAIVTVPCRRSAMWAESPIGHGTALTPAWSGAPVSFRGVPTSAAISTQALSRNLQAASGVSEWFRDRGLWQDNSYEPRPGDIIFSIGITKVRQARRTENPIMWGLLKKVENGTVYTVEGNSGDSCRENHYAIGYYEILGYGMPQY